MRYESDEVTDDEFLLRRVVIDPQFYKPELEEPITRRAFLPNKRDTDGISMYREHFCTAEEVARTGNNPKGYCVAALTAEFMRSHDLSLQPDPTPDPPQGHTLVPEIREDKALSQEQKERMKEISDKLAQEACKAIRHNDGTSSS